jgi:AcrR family transcriptional regulator
MDTENPSAELGLREIKKRDKLRRIKAAAGSLFLEKGYDDATTREIASRAGVGLGTLFFYASDKRDLLFLIYNDQQEELTRAAFGQPPSGRSFLDRVVAAFGVFYRFFAEEPVFMRYVLRELTFYASGRQAGRFNAGREAVIDGIEALFRAAREAGELGSTEASRAVARLVFGVYQAEVRRWLTGERPDPAAGLASLERALRIVVDGLKPAPAAD